MFLNTHHLPLGYANAAGNAVVEKENGARLSRALQQNCGPASAAGARGENAFELGIPEQQYPQCGRVQSEIKWTTPANSPRPRRSMSHLLFRLSKILKT